MHTQTEHDKYGELLEALQLLQHSVINKSSENSQLGKILVTQCISDMNEQFQHFRQFGRAHSEVFQFWDEYLQLATLMLQL